MRATLRRLLLVTLPPAAIGRLRAWRVNRAIRTYPARRVEHAYGAGTFRVWLADPVAEEWYDRDWPALPEIATLGHAGLREGARVFDIGAHQGIVAMMLAREVGASGRVIAVEAHPHNAQVAAKNRDLNGMQNIEVLQAAVSDHAGTARLNPWFNGRIDDSLTHGFVTVDTVTVDGLAERFGMPDVMFLDIEGAECLALAAASKVLSCRTDWFIEVHVGCGLEKLGGSVDEVFSYFPADRYAMLGRAEGDSAFRPVSRHDPLTRDRFFLLALARRDAG